MKRKYPIPLTKKGYEPKRLKKRSYIYEFVKDTNLEPRPNLDVILTKYVEGLGNIGDKVSVKPHYGYNHLLLPGLAVYASPSNLEKYKNYQSSEAEIRHSSPTAARVRMFNLHIY